MKVFQSVRERHKNIQRYKFNVSFKIKNMQSMMGDYNPRYLSAECTSTVTERLFGTPSHVIDEKRYMDQRRAKAACNKNNQ